MNLKLRTPLGLVLIAAIVLPLRGSSAPTANLRMVVPAGREMPVAKLCLDRLEEYAAATVQVAYGSAGVSRDAATGPMIYLGSINDAPTLQGAWAAHAGARADSYLIKTISRDPLTMIASGIDARGTLYAAYHLADLLRAKGDLSAVDIFREPRIAERFVSFGATTHGRKQYVPEQHWKTLRELPDFGYNGLVIYPGGGTPIGRRSSPIVEAADGNLSLEAENTAKWRAWFGRVKQYQLDLMMTVPPIVPPGYQATSIASYYAGGPQPRGYLPALKTHFRHYLELLTATYPELDRFMFNSTEGATFGRNERFFGAPQPDRFPPADYLRNNEEVMRAYFDVLAEFFGEKRSRVYFWTHSFGLTSEGLAKMREILFTYPWVTIIEDDFWNNNLWPHDLPAMAYLPPPLRERVSAANPFALFQIATDGEYHGGGALPNAYPGSHMRSAREAVARHARMVIQRLDLHDRTPYGTAFGPMKIVPYAASKQLWAPTPTEPEIWHEWAATRFGAAAAESVIAALQESHTVLVEGLSGNGIDLLAVGSEFQPRLWQKERTGVSRFSLFGKPGELLVKKQPGDVITSGEYTAWQMGTRALRIGEFRRHQENAAAAVARGLGRIEQAKPHLVAADFAMLRAIFTEGENVLRAVRLLGEVAYAANLLLDNFDHDPDPRGRFEKAAAGLQAFLEERKLIPEMTKNLSSILRSYRDGSDQKL